MQWMDLDGAKEGGIGLPPPMAIDVISIRLQFA